MAESDKNFNFLVVYICSKILERLTGEEEISVEEEMVLLHNSETFGILCRKETGMYIESPAYVYEILKEELRRGTIKGITE